MSNTERDALLARFEQLMARESELSITESIELEETAAKLERERLRRERSRAALNRNNVSIEVPPPDPAAPQVLLDLWHVYHNPKEFDTAPAHKQLRELWRDDINRFVSLMTAQEREWKTSKASLEHVDIGEKAALEKLELLLKEFQDA